MPFNLHKQGLKILLTLLSLCLYSSKVYYGFVEAIVVSLYCIWAFKNGWSKAPHDVTLWKALTTSYEVKTIEDAEQPQGDGIHVPSINVKVEEDNNNKDAWDYVDYGDAEVGQPSAQPKKKEPNTTSGGWFNFM